MPQRSMLNSDMSQAKTNDTRNHVSSAVMQGLHSECSAVWFNRGVFEMAESRYYIGLQERQNGTMAAPNTSNCQNNHNASLTKSTFDQAENLIKSKSSKRGSRKKRSPSKKSNSPIPKHVNGIPLVPAELQGVWLQKPSYDQAETAFYKNMYIQNETHATTSKKQTGPKKTSNNITFKTKSDKTKEKKPRNYVIKKEDGMPCHLLHADSESVRLELVTKTSKSAQIFCSPSLKYDFEYIHTQLHY